MQSKYSTKVQSAQKYSAHVYAIKGTEPLMTGIQGTAPCGDSC